MTIQQMLQIVQNEWIFLLVIGVLLLYILFVDKIIFYCQKQHVAVITRFGKFHRIVLPGVSVIFPFIEQVFLLDMRQKFLDVVTTAQKFKCLKNHTEMKIDNEFFIAIDYQIRNNQESIRNAFFFSFHNHNKLFSSKKFEKTSSSCFEKKINRSISENVQAIVSFLSLKELQDDQEFITLLLSRRLQKNMEEVGVTILNLEILTASHRIS